MQLPQTVCYISGNASASWLSSDASYTPVFQNYPAMSWAQRAFPAASPFGYPAAQPSHQQWGFGVWGPGHHAPQPRPPQPPVHEIGHAYVFFSSVMTADMLLPLL
jgi:hypothetical protein